MSERTDLVSGAQRDNPTARVSLLALLAVLGILVFGARDALRPMVSEWGNPEYSYGYFVPLLVAFFIWQKKHDLAQVRLGGSWGGVWLALLGLFVMLFGELATLYTIVQYGFLIALHGVAWAYLGSAGYRIVVVPLAMLFFVVPLPDFLYMNLSARLQLISSEIGVWVIRQFDISVFLEGNVIHLAEMQLQVVDACSGLRYLFPLMAVGFMVAYLFNAPLWKKAVLFLSTIPITVLMNSLRIGLIGVTVHYWGKAMAEGVLHEFEGWVMFTGSLVVLAAEMALLSRIGRRQRFAEAFHIDFQAPLKAGAPVALPPVSKPLVTTLALVTLGVTLAMTLPQREEVIPERTAFVHFPQDLGDWRGQTRQLEPIYVHSLNFDDYLLNDYVGPAGERVNLYVAYYGSQRKGASVHSPRTCIPGGGWQITDLRQQAVDGVTVNGRPLQVNRTLIRNGDDAQLVYYWFPQRGRLMTNEYLVKWYLFVDALRRGRTDGALVRLTTSVPLGEDLAAADARLAALARVAVAALPPFLPD